MRDSDLLELRQQGWSPRKIAKRYGLNEDSVRSRISRATREGNADEALPLYTDTPQNDDDLDKWASFVTGFKLRKRMLKLALLYDVHLPDDNKQSIDLTMQCIEALEPDAIFLGGDTFDFDTLSTKFQRNYNRIRRDAFKEVEEPYVGFLDKLDRFSVPILSLGGNHCYQRLMKYINERAPEFGDTLSERFNELVRQKGRVWFAGWRDEMRIHSLILEHGTRVGENSAKAALRDRGWANTRVGGHTHSPSWAINVLPVPMSDMSSSMNQIVLSYTIPALCNPNPHYMQRHSTRWVNGMGIAHINLHDVDIHLQTVIYHPRMNGELATVIGGKELVQKPFSMIG